MSVSLSLVVSLPTKRGDVIPTAPIPVATSAESVSPRMWGHNGGAPLLLTEEEMAAIMPDIRRALKARGYRLWSAQISAVWLQRPAHLIA